MDDPPLKPGRQASAGYQDEIFAHAKQPFGYGPSLPGSAEVTEVNALCGDAVTIGLRYDEAGAAQLRFTAAGCSLCRASASLLLAAATGRKASDLAQFVAHFQRNFPDVAAPVPLDGATAALYDLRRFPARQRCVLLPWDALAKLLYS